MDVEAQGLTPGYRTDLTNGWDIIKEDSCT